MGNTYINGVQIVKVTTPGLAGELPTVTSWAVAASRADATGILAKVAPEGSSFELTNQRLTPEHVERLRLIRPGDAREMTS